MSSRWPATVVSSLLVAIVASGCSALGFGSRESTPCGAKFSADRCQALAAAAAEDIGVAFDAIAQVNVVPDPSPN